MNNTPQDRMKHYLRKIGKINESALKNQKVAEAVEQLRELIDSPVKKPTPEKKKQSPKNRASIPTCNENESK
jgi:hypothetical protein